MFADAYEKATHFTNPLIVFVRHFDGTVGCGIGASVVLNSEGWVGTVAHAVTVVPKARAHRKEIAAYEKKVEAVKENRCLDAKERRQKIEQIEANPKWITDYSIFWGAEGVTAKENRVLLEADLALVRLNPFQPDDIAVYPVLKDPSNLRCGTSLCKLGYPFYSIKATWDGERFQADRGQFPIPRFPIEGILTRKLVCGKSKDQRYDIKFLETSSPGLMGQSGGPIFDVNGTVWGIQSSTHHLPLGFSPKVKKNDTEVEEHQFLNAGQGVHPETLIPFLRDNRIKFKLSDY